MNKVTRRSFVKNIGLGVGSAAMLPGLMSFENSPLLSAMPYNGEKLNIALCGLGRYANILATGLQETEFCSLTGIITGTPEKEKIWKDKYQIPEENIYNYENFEH